MLLSPSLLSGKRLIENPSFETPIQAPFAPLKRALLCNRGVHDVRYPPAKEGGSKRASRGRQTRGEVEQKRGKTSTFLLLLAAAAAVRSLSFRCSSLLAVLLPRLAFPLPPPFPSLFPDHSPAHSMTWSPEGVLRVTLKARALTAPARAGRRAAVEGLAATRAPAMREVERRASDIFDAKGRGKRKEERSYGRARCAAVRDKGKRVVRERGEESEFFFSCGG